MHGESVITVSAESGHVHPSQLPALKSPREVAEDLYLAAIWNGYHGEGLSDDGLPSLVVSRGGQDFRVWVEVYR